MKARTINLINDKNSDDKDLIDYINKLMKTDILSGKSQVDIEKLMTFMDIEIENTNNRESYKIQIFKERLLEIIIMLFEKLSKNLKTKVSDYNDFIKKVKDNDTVISFNWDVLLDKIFLGKNQYSNLTNLIQKDTSPVILDEPINSDILSEKAIT